MAVLTSAINDINKVISNMSKYCHIVYFMSENREIIETAINESSALSDKLGKDFASINTNGNGTRYQQLCKAGKCVSFTTLYNSKQPFSDLTIEEKRIPAILYLTDFQVYDDKTKAYMVKAFLDCEKLKNSFLLISSPELHIPDGFGSSITLIHDKYISKKDILIKLTALVREEENKRQKKYFTDRELDNFAQDFVGLSSKQVDTVFEQMHGVLCTSLLKKEHRILISNEKKAEVSKDSTISFREVPKTESVCGMGNYSRWLKSRAQDFRDPITAQSWGTPAPKGVLLCGVPGTGKSAAAKETARVLGYPIDGNPWNCEPIPLIQFDISRLQTKNFGGSEERLRRYLDRISAFGNCVMMMDEIEKVFAMTDGTHEVKRAMLSLLLDWMQTRKANVFTFITANDISNLPPELLRDGRISGRFFAFMPSCDDLSSILQLKLRELIPGKLFNNEFEKLITNPLKPGNQFAKMFNSLAEEAEKQNERYLFMTGANLEVLIEMTNRKMREKTGKGYAIDEYLKTMKQCALSRDFVPQGQSNMTDIVNMWLAAQERQYQDISANAILPFDKFKEDGTFEEISEGGRYDEYLRKVLKKRIKETVDERADRKNFLKKNS